MHDAKQRCVLADSYQTRLAILADIDWSLGVEIRGLLGLHEAGICEHQQRKLPGLLPVNAAPAVDPSQLVLAY